MYQYQWIFIIAFWLCEQVYCMCRCNFICVMCKCRQLYHINQAKYECSLIIKAMFDCDYRGLNHFVLFIISHRSS